MTIGSVDIEILSLRQKTSLFYLYNGIISLNLFLSIMLNIKKYVCKIFISFYLPEFYCLTAIVHSHRHKYFHPPNHTTNNPKHTGIWQKLKPFILGGVSLTS